MRCWGNDYVIYNISTGDTHQVSSFGAITLLKLQESLLDESDLIDYFSSPDVSDLERDSASSLVFAILSSFENLGLIERAV